MTSVIMLSLIGLTYLGIQGIWQVLIHMVKSEGYVFYVDSQTFMVSSCKLLGHNIRIKLVVADYVIPASKLSDTNILHGQCAVMTQTQLGCVKLKRSRTCYGYDIKGLVYPDRYLPVGNKYLSESLGGKAYELRDDQ